MNDYEAWERFYDDAIMAQSRKYTQAWKKAFADEAVRNCNKTTGNGDKQATRKPDLDSAASKRKETQ